MISEGTGYGTLYIDGVPLAELKDVDLTVDEPDVVDPVRTFDDKRRTVFVVRRPVVIDVEYEELD